LYISTYKYTSFLIQNHKNIKKILMTVFFLGATFKVLVKQSNQCSISYIKTGTLILNVPVLVLLFVLYHNTKYGIVPCSEY
jgi:uncharacterized membrane protein